jgi:hydrogenase nickel incorporation protein HypB
MFRASDLMLLTKTDLLEVLDDFDTAQAERALRLVGSAAPVLHASPRKGAGIAQWIDWLEGELVAQRARIAAGTTRRPAVQSEGARLHATEPSGGGHGHGAHHGHHHGHDHNHDHDHDHDHHHAGGAKR